MSCVSSGSLACGCVCVAARRARGATAQTQRLQNSPPYRDSNKPISSRRAPTRSSRESYSMFSRRFLRVMDTST